MATVDPLGVPTLEDWLWAAASSIRGPVDAPKFKDYILPLIFVKRLSDVFDDEIERLTRKFNDRETVLELIEADHSLVRFYLPHACAWEDIRKLSTNLQRYFRRAGLPPAGVHIFRDRQDEHDCP